MSGIHWLVIALVMTRHVWVAWKRSRVIRLLRERHPAKWEELGRPTWWRFGNLDFGPDANGRQLDDLGDDDVVESYRACVTRTKEVNESLLVALVLGVISLIVIAALLTLVV